MDNVVASFENFIEEFSKCGYDISTQDLDNETKFLIGRIWDNTLSFLEDTKLVSSHESLNDLNSKISTVGMDLQDVGHQEIISYVRSCNVPESYVVPCAKAVALCIQKYRESNVGYEHYVSSNESLESVIGKDGEIRKLDDIYSIAALNNLYYENPTAALESFGVNIDQTIADVRLAMAVTVMKFGKGILPRLIPNIPTDKNVALYDVSRAEVYDFTKSGDPSAIERYEGSHRFPFIELRRDPSIVDSTSVPVVVKEANDTADDFVFQDGYLRPGKRANMFNLAKDENTPGFDYIDYTDLLSEGVKVKSLVVEMEYDDGTNNYVEQFEFDVSEVQGSRFVMAANVSDAADRICNIDHIVALKNDATQMDGTASQIMALFDANHIVKLNLYANGTVSLKTSFINLLTSTKASLDTLDSSTPAPAMVTIFNNIKRVEIIAYQPDAYYSEENFRKTTLAARILKKTFGYEIRGTRNVLLTLSHREKNPENVVQKLNEMIRIGNDYRGIKIIIDAMNKVYNAIKQEEIANPPYDKRVFNNYIAGNLCKPYVYLDGINISAEVQFMRSAEQLGDVRGLVEKKLLEIITIIHNMSYFEQALPQGQRPVYKILTSGYIKDVVLNVPFYKTIEDQPAAEKAGDDNIEYRRILSNGTELHIITTTWDFMTDKILMVPHIPSQPSSPLNFAHLWDRGVYVAQITPYLNRASFKEIIANQREFPIVTNPIGAIITVSGIDNVFTGIASLGS
jgi:hypothetical protein